MSCDSPRQIVAPHTCPARHHPRLVLLRHAEREFSFGDSRASVAFRPLIPPRVLVFGYERTSVAWGYPIRRPRSPWLAPPWTLKRRATDYHRIGLNHGVCNARRVTRAEYTARARHCFRLVCVLRQSSPILRPPLVLCRADHRRRSRSSRSCPTCFEPYSRHVRRGPPLAARRGRFFG